MTVRQGLTTPLVATSKASLGSDEAMNCLAKPRQGRALLLASSDASGRAVQW
jgi:hypothetical protein